MQVLGATWRYREFFTLSKSYNMAGWRIGFMVGNKTSGHAPARIKAYRTIMAPLPCFRWRLSPLWKAIPQCVRDIAEQYKRRRDVLAGRGLHEAADG